MPVIALDLGGTKLAGALFTERGRMLSKQVHSLDGRGGREVGALIKTATESLLAFARHERLRVTAIGVSVPGISHADTGRVWAPNIPGWRNYPLRRELDSLVNARSRRARKPAAPIPVWIEGDRACYILGEAWRGAAKGCRNAIFLAVGTGIGAGILIDGHILRGAHGSAGAIGWMALDRPFEPHYVSCGCFEHHASGVGLTKVCRAFLEQAHLRSPLRQVSAATEIFAAFQRGDGVAKRVLLQAVEFWGMAVANLVSLFNPEKIIFGGGVFGPATRFLEDIYAEASQWAQPIAIRQVKLLPSTLGSDAGLFGAGALALEAQKSH